MQFSKYDKKPEVEKAKILLFVNVALKSMV